MPHCVSLPRTVRVLPCALSFACAVESPDALDPTVPVDTVGSSSVAEFGESTDGATTVVTSSGSSDGVFDEGESSTAAEGDTTDVSDGSSGGDVGDAVFH